MTYKEFRDNFPIVPSKNCENCKHWEADTTNITKKILNYQNYYKENTKLFNDNIWVGECKVSNKIDYFKDSSSEQNISEPIIVVGKQPSEKYTCFKFGSQVYFGYNEVDLLTFNTFCCEECFEEL